MGYDMKSEQELENLRKALNQMHRERNYLAPQSFYKATQYVIVASLLISGLWSAAERPNLLFDLLSAVPTALCIFFFFLSSDAKLRK